MHRKKAFLDKHKPLTDKNKLEQLTIKYRLLDREGTNEDINALFEDCFLEDKTRFIEILLDSMEQG